MDAGSILLVLALTIAVITIIARPFVFSQENQRDPRDHAISALRAEHEQILTILQEMELDHVMGKISDADYQALRQETLERGADVLRKLDDLGMTADDTRKMEAPREPDPLGLEAKIEQEIAKRRATARTCSECGKPVLEGDLFCSNCGHSLNHEEASA